MSYIINSYKYPAKWIKIEPHHVIAECPWPREDLVAPREGKKIGHTEGYE